MPAPVIMVVGTASSVGKSTLVTALCRIAARRGLRVAPFKAQNMSNNAAVTADGGEIARSIAVQAEAARIAPTVQMNPILLKPEGQRRSQIIVEGTPWQTLDALTYWQRKSALWEVVTRNLDTLREQYDLVIAEGAGSPVELNLKPHDIVNMRVAMHTQARTLLVGDIDVGGIFASMLGTLMLLEPEEQSLIHGLVVNRFRGDPELFRDGIRILQERSGVPVAGVVPWIDDMGLAEEDAVALERSTTPPSAAEINIAVINLPHIANFDDFDALQREPGVAVRFITAPYELSGTDAVILPGTKHTLFALEWLRERGFFAALAGYHEQIVGICGGYQILGEAVSDPDAVEGTGGTAPGLGLLPMTTRFATNKRTAQVSAQSHLPWAQNLLLHGYEIHMGRTMPTQHLAPAITITRRGSSTCTEWDGAVRADGRVWGCYLHGIFNNDEFRHAWLQTLGWNTLPHVRAVDPYDRLADYVEAHLDPEFLHKLLSQ